MFGNIIGTYNGIGECPKTKGQLKRYNNKWVPEVVIRNLRTRLTVISLHGQNSLQNLRIHELQNFMRHGFKRKVGTDLHKSGSDWCGKIRDENRELENKGLGSGTLSTQSCK
jgi:hypothetical protein